MPLTPVIAIHTTFAISAVALGPLALWARLGRALHPRLHRAAGYAWVTCMAGTALSAIFITSNSPLRIAGFGPIHLLILLTLSGLLGAMRAIVLGDVKRHRRIMVSMYISACIVTGLFTLLPGRLLGQVVWGQWLGWI